MNLCRTVTICLLMLAFRGGETVWPDEGQSGTATTIATADNDFYLFSTADTASLQQMRGSDFRMPMENIRQRIWYRGFGNFMAQGVQNNQEGIDAWSAGLSLGYERRWDRYLTVGAGIGGNWSSVDQSEIHDKTNISAMFTAIYGRMEFRRTFLMLEAGYGYNDFSRRREDALGTWNGDRSANQWHARAECGFWWESGFSNFEPFAALQFVTLDEPGYAEKNGHSTRYHDAWSDSKTTLLTGLRYSWQHAGPLAHIAPTMYGGLAHELASTDLFSIGTYGDAPTVYRVPGATPRTDRFFVGGGLSCSMRRRLDLYFRYTAEVASGYSSHTLLGGMNWNF